MNSTRTSHHPSPDAYDHVWSLLPLHMTFLFYLLLSLLTNNVPLVAQRASPERLVPDLRMHGQRTQTQEPAHEWQPTARAGKRLGHLIGTLNH